MEKDERAELEAAFRSACWVGAWRMLGVVGAVGLLVAILFPVLNQSKGGPKTDDVWPVARAIEVAHQDTGRWPTEFDEVRERLHFRRFHTIGFVKLMDRGQEAEYVVSVDQRLVAFRIGTGVHVLPDRIAKGTVSPQPSAPPSASG